VLSRLGRHEAAAETLRRLIALAPKEASHRMDLAEALRALKRWDEAITVLQDAMKQLGPSVRLQYRVGMCHAGAGRDDKAMAAYREAAKLDDKHHSPHLLMGRLREKQGDHVGALRGYKDAHRRAPSDPDVLKALGAAYSRAGEPRRAMDCYQRAVKVSPGDAMARAALSVALKNRGEVKAAIRLLREGLRLAPEDQTLLIALSLTQMVGRDSEGAVETAHACLAAHPEDPNAHGTLARAFEFNGQFVEARISARRALDANARRSSLNNEDLKGILKGCERLAAAEARLPAALRGDTKPDGEEAMQLGRVCARKGMNRRALEFFKGPLLGEPGLPDMAARAAARLARGLDAEKTPDDVERARAAGVALTWLTKALPDLRRGLETGPRKQRQAAAAWARRWLEADDFAPWRDIEKLARIAGPERGRWQSLWDEMRALVRKAEVDGL
jgi:tetratricopeptide (TPR) repeat protein